MVAVVRPLLAAPVARSAAPIAGFMDIDEVDDETWESVASVILRLLGVGALCIRSWDKQC